MTRPARYLSALLAIALVTGLCAYAGRWATQVIGCRMLDRSGAYLAYCDTPAFGSYEHEAYALNFEPRAVQAMREAEVLFLGNSRVQFAFSTASTDAFFKARHLSYHLLGFGYGESSAFPRILLARHRPSARVIVIDADPFFQPALSPAAETLFKLKRQAIVDALLKKGFGRLQLVLCRLGHCPQSVPSTYRDRSTGRWIWKDLLLPADTIAGPITAAKAQSWSEAVVPAWAEDAKSFLAELPLRRDCVILTGVPTPAIDAEGMAAELGRRLNLTVIQPSVAGLTSLDNSHLSAASAERWSAAFLAEIAPILDRCADGKPPP